MFDEATTEDFSNGSDEARALFHLLDGIPKWPDYDTPYEFTKSFRVAGCWSECNEVDSAIWCLLNSINAAKYFWLNFERAQGEWEKL